MVEDRFLQNCLS